MMQVVSRPGPAIRGNTRLTAAVVIAGACAFLPMYATQPLLPEFTRLFHAGEDQVSLTVTGATLAVCLSAPLVGVVADRFGRKRSIGPAALGLAAATALAATAGSLHQLVAWRFAQGLFVPGLIAVIVAYIAEEAPPTAAGSVTAAYVTGTVVGGLTGRLACAWTAQHFGWRNAFLLLAGMTLLGALAVWRWLPASRNFHRTTDPLDSARAMLQHLRNSKLLATYFVGFNALFCLVGIFTSVTFYLAAPPFHLSTAALGLVFLVYALGVVVTPASGPAIDRLGHRAAMVCATAIVAAGAALTLVHSLPAVVAGLAVLSTGVFVGQSAASSHVALSARHTRSAATGLYTCFYYLGGSAGSASLGAAWRLGRWPACVAIVLAVQFLAAAVAHRYFSRPTPEPDPALTPLPTELT